MSTSRVFSVSAFSSAAVAALVSHAQPSRADVLPPDGCNGSAGSSCDNAGPNNDEPGVCVETTCPHHGPTGADASDFDAETEEPCVLRQMPDGGSSTAPSKSSSGGCSTSPGSPAGGGLGLMLAAGVAFGTLQRRRRAV